MPSRLPWEFTNRFRIEPGCGNPFETALTRLELGYGVANVATRPEYNEARYKCAVHEECKKKFKLVLIGNEKQDYPMDSMHDEILHGPSCFSQAYLVQQVTTVARFRVTESMLDHVKQGRLLTEECVFLDGFWEAEHFASLLTSGRMLASLLWYLEARPDGFPLYMDAQNKIILGDLKVAWLGTTRVWFDAGRNEYRHTFVPFMLAIIDEECQAAYEHLLDELDKLVQFFTDGQRELRNCVNLCVHDAHQGAIRACQTYLPGIRNARCYYHLSKNLKDNRSKFGVDAALVDHLKYALHASPTDDLFYLLSVALIEEIDEEYQIIRSLRNTSPQHLVRRPERIDFIEYNASMMAKGTGLVTQGSLKEVTSLANRIQRRPDDNVQVRYFLVESNRIVPANLASTTSDDEEIYLRGLLASDFPNDGLNMSLDDVLFHYYRFHLVTLSRTALVCTCKGWRDWGCCGHAYGVEILCGTQVRYYPQDRQIRNARRGRPSSRRNPADDRYRHQNGRGNALSDSDASIISHASDDSPAANDANYVDSMS
ncbi:hypothetical protein FOL47_011238, partial [Perkinsus chesapeaki]